MPETPENQEVQNKSNPLLFLLRMSWRYSPCRKNIVTYWIMFLMANVFSIVCAPLVIAHVIDMVQKGGVTRENFTTILYWLCLILFVDILFWSLHGPARLIEQNNAFGNRLNYRKHLIGGVLALPLSWHVDHHSGDTIDKVNKGADALFDFSESSFQVIYSFVQLVGCVSMLLYFSWYAGVAVLVVLGISMWITVQFDRVTAPQYKELSAVENRISQSTFDAISNITTVVILRVERLIFKSIVHEIEAPFELFKKNNLLNEVKWCLTSLCCSVMMIAVLGFYFWQNINTPQGVMMGSVYLLLKYLDKISEVFFNFTDRYSSIIRKFKRVENAEILTRDFKPEGMVNHVLPKTWQKVEIQNLNFSYHTETGSKLHLKNVCMALHRGRKIALVGESGGGKTTALKLIRGLYVPESLRLLVDGQEIPEGFDGISQAIALVPQSPEIFANTILRNITMGAEYSMDLIEWAMQIACFTDVLPKLPKGLESSTKEKGVNLSAGQNQRLALARGLLASLGKDIVLLDEPTSSLDPVTEKIVYQNIFGAFPEKTIVSSIHKLHLLSLFDYVYVFKDGEIVGEGTFESLRDSNLAFQALWASYLKELEEKE